MFRDVALSPSVRPFMHRRASQRALCWRRILGHSKALGHKVFMPNRSTPDYLFEEAERCFRRSRTDSNVRVQLEALGNMFCKIWYLISRTVSDDDAHCGDMMIARSALSPSSPRLRRAAICGIGLDRSARPSKSGDRAANALTATLGDQGTRLSDNVRQVECWFSQIIVGLWTTEALRTCSSPNQLKSYLLPLLGAFFLPHLAPLRRGFSFRPLSASSRCPISSPRFDASFCEV